MDDQSTQSLRLESRAEWKRNWRSALACMIGMGLGGSVTLPIFSLFILPLQHEFGWSRSDIANVFAAGFVTALLAPLVGALIDAVGVRRPLLMGLVSIALCYVGLAMMDGQLAVFYILVCLLLWTGLATTGMPYAKIISQHFDRARGVALAVSRSGMAIATALLPIVLYFLITTIGWRSAYLAMAAMIVCLNITAVYMWVRDPDHGADNSVVRVPRPAMAWGRVLRDKQLILLCAIAVFGYAPTIALQTQLQPLIVDRGFGGSFAATMVGTLGVASFVGALVTGALIDRFDARLVGLVFALLSAVGGALLLANVASTGLLVVAIVLIGLGLGAEIDLLAYLVSRIFGVAIFASVFGIISCVLSVAVAGWSMTLGYTYDLLGSYAPFLMLITGTYLVAGLLYPALAKGVQRLA